MEGFPIVLSEILKAFPAIVLAVVSYMLSKVTDMAKKVADIEGGMREIKQWSHDHEKADDRRFETMSEQIRALSVKLDRVIEKNLSQT